MRLFLDTNVLLSGLMGHGLCRDLLDRAVLEADVLIGAPVLREVDEKLRVKFRVPAALRKELRQRLGQLEQAPAVQPDAALERPDPDDLPILACALACGADWFVTGDKALLAMAKVRGLPVVSPREAWGLLNRRPSSP